MTKYKFLKKPSETEEFGEASSHELKVLVALFESDGVLDEEGFVLSSGVSRARLNSALTLWQEAGVIAPCCEDNTQPPSAYGISVTEEFADRVILGELEEESGQQIAATIRNRGLASLFDECAAMMNKSMLTPAEIRRISELASQYELSEEYIALLAAHLNEENMLSVGILVKRAMTLAGRGIANVETLSEYIADSEREKNEMREYKRIFGIYDRSLSKRETEYIEKWSKEYGFGTEIVGMAYDIGVMNTAKRSFSYMDKLLTDWHNASCKTVSDCEARYEERKRELDAEAEEKRRAAEARRASPKREKPRYGDFDPEEAFRLALMRSSFSDGNGSDS